MNQNLLSQEEKKALRRGYRKRLIILSLWGVFFISIISAIIFLPVFFMAQTKITHLTNKEEASSVLIEAEKSILSLPLEINEKSKIILSFKNAPNIYQKISQIVEGKPSGVYLRGFSYQGLLDVSSKGQAKILVSGIAKDRDSLIAFSKNLKNLDFVKDAVVPVGSFAKESDLSFTISVLLK